MNLIAAVAAFWALTLAAKPADRTHHYGHFKAEYFSSGLESVLIVAAALAILHTAIGRLQQPQPLEQLGLGLAISLAATALNALVAWVLLRAARRFDSITLRADAHHLLTDVWTSVGVVLGIGLVKLTGLTILDPLIAIVMDRRVKNHARNLLLMTATQHNGKEEDFQLFMALLDEDRFAGHQRNAVHRSDPTDLMRGAGEGRPLHVPGHQAVSRAQEHHGRI